MTFLQIQYILDCNSLGSISKAALKNFTSTSNMSKTIKSVEAELGYRIFNRTESGVSLTEEGRLFMAHAARIIQEMDAITQLKHPKNHNCFTISFMYNFFYLEAVAKMVELWSTELIPKPYNLISCSYDECIELVKSGKSDVSLTAIPQSFGRDYMEIIEANGLNYHYLQSAVISIIIRKDHPLLKEYDASKPFNMELLWDYPYINVEHAEMDDVPAEIQFSLYKKYINPKLAVTVNTNLWRNALIGRTNGFGIAFAGSKSFLESNKLTAIQFAENSISLFAITNGITLSKETEMFIHLLKAEL